MKPPDGAGVTELTTRATAKDSAVAEQTKGQTTQLVAHRTGELQAAAMPQLAAQLADAVREMDADDVYVELDGKKNGDTSELRFRFRAYRRTKE